MLKKRFHFKDGSYPYDPKCVSDYIPWVGCTNHIILFLAVIAALYAIMSVGRFSMLSCKIVYWSIRHKNIWNYKYFELISESQSNILSYTNISININPCLSSSPVITVILKCYFAKFFVCSSQLSWYLTFFLKTLSKVLKLAYNTERFLYTIKIQTFFAIANYHLRSLAITSLKPGLQQKSITPWRSAGRDADFSVPYFFLFIYLVSGILA